MNPNEKKRMTYNMLRKRIVGCRECSGLGIPKVSSPAFLFGNYNSDIMFLGQSACYKCMLTGIPFYPGEPGGVKGSGYLIDEVLDECELKRSDVYITNVIKCHPPKNRPSFPYEIKNCGKYLNYELELIDPKIIIALGKDSISVCYERSNHKEFYLEFLEEEANRNAPLRILLEHNKSNEILIKTKKGSNIKVFSFYHPSYIMKRNEFERSKYVSNIAQIIKGEVLNFNLEVS